VLIGRAMTISIYWSSFVTSYKFFFKNDEKNFQKIGCASHSQSTKKKNIIEAVGELPMYNITLPKEQKNWKKKKSLSLVLPIKNLLSFFVSAIQ
jgi:hypothetical protein